MSHNKIWTILVLLAAGALALAGCGAGSGGGGGGSGGLGGAPTLTGTPYVLTDDTGEEIDVTVAVTEWLAVFRQSGAWLRGPKTVLPSGILKMAVADASAPGAEPFTLLYGFEIPGGFLFLLNADDLVADGGYHHMKPAFDRHGSCASIGTQGNYNLVKTGQVEFSQVTGRAFGTAELTAATGGLDLAGATWKVGQTLNDTSTSLETIPTLPCADGIGESATVKYLFTSIGVGLYRRIEGADTLDFVAMPEPSSTVDGGALVTSDKVYVGMYQQMMETSPGVMEEQTFFVTGTGNGVALDVDSFNDIEAGTYSGQPGTYSLARSAVTRHGMFDDSEMSFGTPTPLITPGVVAVHSAGGKSALAFIGRFDANSNSYVDEPWDWFFMLLLER